MNKTHDQSCLLDSFSHVLNICPERLWRGIGHDGFIHGFHTQELIEEVYKYGFAVTMIERKCGSINPKTGEVHYIEFGDCGSEKRFVDCMWNKIGILMGLNKKRHPHAVAWEFNRIWDPSDGSCYPHIEADIGVGSVPEPRFTARNFLRIDRVL